jgi:glycosyltransferase involved in cell wall biosynthesis
VVAPPWYPLPPRGYGGIELMVYLLGRELRRLGHEVTLFGAEGSAPGVEMLAPAGWSGDLDNPRAHPFRVFTYLARVAKQLEAAQFDVVHDNSSYPGIFLWTLTGAAQRFIHTIHEPLLPPLTTFLAELQDRVQFAAVSRAQAAGAPDFPISAVVHNAVDIDELRVRATGRGYLLELGRIDPEKGQHLAVEIARRTGRTLVLAGKLPPLPHAERYFEKTIKPHLGERVVYRGNVAGPEKAELIAGADAGLFPLQWDEPFGLAMAECMVSGTPVLALRRGSAAEIVDQGVTGFVHDELDELVDAVDRISEIDRRQCALLARERFSPARMAREYLSIYDG